MTEPTDAELWQFYMTLPGATPTSQPDPIEIMRATLAKWGTPAVAKWAPEEIADGERGIRWVTEDGIHGRPTDHDVREYLKRTPTAHGCHCDECKQFYTTPQPTQTQAGAVLLTDNELVRRSRVGAIQTDENGKVVMWPAYYRTQMEDRFKRGWREAEKHHGIKGGQHG